MKRLFLPKTPLSWAIAAVAILVVALGLVASQAIATAMTGEGVPEIDLSQTLRRDVIPLSPQVTVPDGFPMAEYASTVGLAILDARRPKMLGRSSD
jgi:hypothetical protein